MMNRRHFIKAVGSAIFASRATAYAAAAKEPQRPRPNYLVIAADDCTYNDLPIYGGKNAATPNIDSLASEGIVFNRAYVSSAMCQPCRSELYTGLYPMRNGCAWNHSASRPNITSMPHHLKSLGYRVGITGKVHVEPAKVYPFTKVRGFDGNCVGLPTKPQNVEGIRRFMEGAPDQPFCLVVALVEPHIPWVMGDAAKYPPEKLTLPRNIADTPRTREDYFRYLAEITYMDGQVGEILDVLEASGKADNTLVMFTSEQGSQFPGCKWTNWDTGLHTGLIARWPGKIKAGQRTDALVQYADVLPTFVGAAGGAEGDHDYDGKSFLGVLTGKKSTHRDFAYGMHNNIPEGPAYPIRTISDGNYRYIRNLRPDEIYIEKHLMGKQDDGSLNNPYWETWVGDSWDAPGIYNLVKRYMRRPGEELYHTAKDPFEMTNLANDPALSDIKNRLSNELDRWMDAQGDPGASLDTQEAFQASRHRSGLSIL